MQQNVYNLAVEPFALKFYLDRVVPYQPFLASKARDTVLPDGEDPIFLHSLTLTIPECDGQTDGRIFMVCCKNLFKMCAYLTLWQFT